MVLLGYCSSLNLLLFKIGHKPYKVTFASDYFPQLYTYAVELIKRWHCQLCVHVQPCGTLAEGKHACVLVGGAAYS